LCQDTPNLVRAVAALWAARPSAGMPKKVGMVLSELVPARSATQSLFESDRRAAELSHAMDDVNREFGASVVYIGSMWGMRSAAPTRVAFNRIPDFDKVVN
jgi:DNA polymerase-4